MDANDFIFVPLVLALGLGLHAVVLRLHSPAEGRLLSWSVALHGLGAVMQVLLTRYYFAGGGDMLGYYLSGSGGAELLRSDFGRFAQALAAAFLQQPDVDPVLAPLLFGGGSSQSLCALSAFVCFATGDSLYAACLLVATLAYLSKVLLYRAFRLAFVEDLRLFVLAGLTLLPSAVYWSSALLKEPVAMILMGPLVLALRWLAVGQRRVAALALIFPCATGIAVTKPYILMALALAGAVHYVWVRFLAGGDVALKPFAIVTAVVLATAGLTLGNRYFGKSEGLTAAAAVASQRRVGYDIEGGSAYQLDAPQRSEDVSKRSVVAELALAPLALITALFRPFIFEARNAVQLFNALEATALLWLFGRALLRKGVAAVVGEVRRSPALLFSVVFVFAVALGTGLASSNLGTLSRYRAPMMPFFFMLLLAFSAKVRGANENGAAEGDAEPQAAA